MLNKPIQNVKTTKKGFTFLIKPEKDKAKRSPKTIEKPIINASSKLKLNLMLLIVHNFMMNIYLRNWRFV